MQMKVCKHGFLNNQFSCQICELEQQLTEKDATARKWESECREIKRRYDESSRSSLNLLNEYNREKKRLRIALEETRLAIGNAYEFGYLRETDEGDVQRMLERINSALGEGDKDEQSRSI